MDHFSDNDRDDDIWLDPIDYEWWEFINGKGEAKLADNEHEDMTGYSRVTYEFWSYETVNVDDLKCIGSDLEKKL